MRRYHRSVAGPFGLGLFLAALGTAVPVAVHHGWAPPAPEATTADTLSPLQHVRHSVASAVEHWLGDLRQPAAPSELGEGGLRSGLTAAGAGLAVIAAPVPVDVERNPLGSADASTRLTRGIQAELQRVGCYGGRLHGTWDQPTRSAMLAFKDAAGSGLRIAGPDYVLLTVLQGQAGGICGRQRSPVATETGSSEQAHSEDRPNPASLGALSAGAMTLGPWPRDSRVSVNTSAESDLRALPPIADAREEFTPPTLKSSAPKPAARPAPPPERTRAASTETFRQSARDAP